MTKYVFEGNNMNYTDLQKRKYVGGYLHIDYANLDSLSGCPYHITDAFDCSYNQLTDLVGGPTKIDGEYKCSHNKLTTLVGGPNLVSGEYICSDNLLSNLTGLPMNLNVLNFSNNSITSLVGIHKIIKKCNAIYFDTNKILVGGIGLLLIENLTNISNYKSEPFEIIEKYFNTCTKGMMECSKELKARGYENYAKL